jgi:hypothetical protein
LGLQLKKDEVSHGEEKSRSKKESREKSCQEKSGQEIVRL